MMFPAIREANATLEYSRNRDDETGRSGAVVKSSGFVPIAYLCAIVEERYGYSKGRPARKTSIRERVIVSALLRALAANAFAYLRVSRMRSITV